MISGKQAEARANLIDAERLVRSRGLAKRTVSRKARFLHHMYTWFRILGESTYVLHEYKTISEDDLFDSRRTPHRGDRIIISQADEQPASRNSEKLDDFLRFRSPQPESDVEDDAPKQQEVALRDIHLEDSRDNPNTMYTDIFGISEIWLSLLSQTTRLANRLDASRTIRELNISSSNLLQRKAQRLEDMICLFVSTFSRTTASTSQPLSDHLHNALNSALVILFYRRIRDVNPWILQSHVEETIKELDSYAREIEPSGRQGWCSVWPAFIAGSEASSTEIQERFLGWIERGETRTGLNCYRATKDFLNELWSRSNAQRDGRDRLSRAALTSITWVDLCREKKLWLMACR